MINTTEKIISIIDSANLNIETRVAISEVVDLIEMQEGKKTNLNLKSFSFARLFGVTNSIENIVYDTIFLDAVLSFSQSNSQNIGIQGPISIIKKYIFNYNLAATHMHEAKFGMRIMLLNLWDKGFILLPSIFTTGPHFPLELFHNVLLRWILTFDPNKQSTGGLKGFKSENRRIYYYGPRLLFSTNWERPEQVSLKDIALLSRAQTLYREKQSSNRIAGNQIPYLLLASNLLKDFPNKVQFNKTDLSNFSLWGLRKEVSNKSFEDFTLSLEDYNNNLNQKIPKIKAIRKRRKPKESIDRNDILNDTKVDIYEALLTRCIQIAKYSSDSMDWKKGIPSYPGREYIDLTTIAPTWIEVFKAYMYQRTHIQEYRTEKTTVSALNILAAYIFYYLPWWKELSPLSIIALPSSPRQFTRYNFVTRHTDDAREMVPATLFDLIEARRPNKNSASGAKRQLGLFFDFIATNYADNDLIAGHNFQNPINIEFDIPRTARPGKTNKEVFPRDIYGYLLHWFYAIEEFGCHLEKLALSIDIKNKHIDIRKSRRLECKQFNFSPKFRYRGKEYELTTIPNIFTWADRQVCDGTIGRVVFLPHCTTLRMLITSYETGLRCQSVQWLDRNSWCKLMTNYSNDSYTFPLYVNTDKTKVNAWSTIIVYRVKNMLQREQVFQELFAETATIPPIHYENNPNSPFELIAPLFRGVNTPSPIHDNGYNAGWKLLMIQFEFFFKEIFKESELKMYKLVPVVDVINSNPITRYKGKLESRAYTPINIMAINTPHSCRASFITNRKGLMELSDLAEQVGHANIIVTSHYDRPSGDDLHDRLKSTDMSLFGDWRQFDTRTGVHIRADQSDSTLVTSFKKDRAGTISKFKFMSPLYMWALDDTERSDDGLTMLKDGPMSHIRFRETHICPVGEECPSDIIERIGEPKRCGCCPLAMKCIDHLTAISAKRNQLVERIKFRQKQRLQMEKAEEPASTLDEIWEAMEMDINELLGWKQSEDILNSLRENFKNTDPLNFIHVESPDIVRNHISRISRPSNEAEFLLQRIADSNAYPIFSTAQVQANSARIKRKLLAGKNEDSFNEWIDDFQDVQSAAQMLGLMMRANNLNMSDVAAHITSALPMIKPQHLLEE